MSLPLGSETQLSQNGARLVYLTSLMAGEDINANTQRISDDGTSVYISTATTTLIATGRGVLKRIVLGETAAGAITVYDNITATGTVLAVLKASIAERTYEIGANFSVGCTIVTAGASKLTAIVGR